MFSEMFSKKLLKSLISGLLQISLVGLVGLASVIGYAHPSHAALPAYSAIKDARVLLRQSLPIKNDVIRKIQLTLEKMPRQANLKRWNNLNKDIDRIIFDLAQKSDNLLASVTPAKKTAAGSLIAQLNETLLPLKDAIDTKKRNEISKGSLTMVLDGYTAPVNAGQFVDLVQRGFYDGQTFSRADDNYFLQAGDPPGPADGFVDPATGKPRTVPIEILVPGKDQPIYGHTLEEVGLTRTLPVLPFSAFGTVAMSHPSEDPNGGSSQFFVYLFESDLTPAGLNLIDGNYTVIGYVTEGEEVLRKLKLEDKIEKVRVISGIENLVQPPK